MSRRPPRRRRAKPPLSTTRLSFACLCVAVLAAALTPSPALGQSDNDADGPAIPKEYRFEFGPLGGYRFFAPDSGLGRAANTPTSLGPASGPLAGARLTLNFNRWMSLEAEFLAVRTHTKDRLTTLGIYGYRGSLLLNLVPTGPVRPFLLAGYGGNTSVPSDDRVPLGVQGGLHAGLGFKIFFNDRGGLRFDGRVFVPPRFARSIIPVGDQGILGGPDFEALGSFFFTFTEVQTNERKIIVQKEIRVEPPPAPPTDPDHDGIFGDADKCPTVPEDRDGFEDSDGCPEPDNDKDGILDAQDKCPLAAETRNGVDDDDGCPEEDTDGDGFIGSQDKCPAAPETKNGYKDDDGCPDEIPAAVRRFTGVIEGINFRTGSAEILPGSYAILERAVAVLDEYKDIRMEISGHTDNRGGADYNRDLSQRRAESVRQFFIIRGIKADRLVSIGYGMDRPLADNRSESGRAQNRRTEFRLLGSP